MQILARQLGCAFIDGQYGTVLSHSRSDASGRHMEHLTGGVQALGPIGWSMLFSDTIGSGIRDRAIDV